MQTLSPEVTEGSSGVPVGTGLGRGFSSVWYSCRNTRVTVLKVGWRGSFEPLLAHLALVVSRVDLFPLSSVFHLQELGHRPLYTEQAIPYRSQREQPIRWPSRERLGV